jgi:hypothetical protein
MPVLLIVFVLIVVAVFLYFFVFTGKSGSERMENDAKRFARLLAIEIKLYENAKVEQGLQNNNLYEVLSERIEAARKTYKKRIGSAEFEKLFDEALVEVLANGDRSKMGRINSTLN